MVVLLCVYVHSVLSLSLSHLKILHLKNVSAIWKNSLFVGLLNGLVIRA